MTQEQKAKAYDEALERAKEWYNNPNSSNIGKSYLYAVFPELKEDEDERIRKGLIKAFGSIGKKEWGGVNVKNAIAWLEKKGEQKPRGKTALEAINEEKVDNVNKVEPKDYSSIDPHFGKHIDKVEPKFKVGDWVVFNNKHQSIYQVEKIEDGYYILRHTHGGTFRVCVLHDESLRLWTIKDAKAGDVLCDIANKNVLIFNEISDGWVKCLCSVHLNNSCCLNCTELYGREEQCSFTPATKEQRDLLFQKMREAGYEWDTEKKELKKVENEIEVPFGVKDSELKGEIYYIPKGFYAEIDDDKVVIKKGEKPTAWSEEDKNFMYDTLSNLTELKDRYGEGYGNVGKCIEWLKSLKPQNRWKPSDEQIKALHDLNLTGNISYAGQWQVLIELYNDLKKLKG